MQSKLEDPQMGTADVSGLATEMTTHANARPACLGEGAPYVLTWHCALYSSIHSFIASAVMICWFTGSAWPRHALHDAKHGKGVDFTRAGILSAHHRVYLRPGEACSA